MQYQLDFAKSWVCAALDPQPKPHAHLTTVKQGWSYLRSGQAVDGTPLCLGGELFTHGLGTHADSEVVVTLDSPAKQLRGRVGIDDNFNTQFPVRANAPLAKVVFSVEVDGDQLWKSEPLALTDPSAAFDIALPEVLQFTLKAVALDNFNQYAHADWVELEAELVDGSELWIGETLETQRLPEGPVFSFVYDGKNSADLLPGWNVGRKTVPSDGGVTEHHIVYTDPVTKLVCALEMREFAGLPAAEWLLRFRNDGDRDTPILEDIQALDSIWPATAIANLYRSKGSISSFDDFAYQQEQVPPGVELAMVADEGRPSHAWLPYFNLQTADTGVIGAIGWTGQWSLTINRSEADDDIRMVAGMTNTHLVLHPGEEIRSPRIALLFWKGEPIDGHNVLRRFIISHHTPKPGGKLIEGPLSSGAWGGEKDEAHLKNIKRVQDKQLDYDIYWIDAGWFGTEDSWSEVEFSGKWYKQAGNWMPNPIAHPNGMREISDAVHAAGKKFLLWFEPERAVWGTEITQQHPEWFIGDQIEGQNVLLNLGNPEARQWLTDFMSAKLDEWDIDWYRQDFNFDPLPYWDKADTPDRQGMSQILHVQGLYQYWDDLLKQRPGLMIDNCASGGRRLDLEMLGRSMALWRSDSQCYPGVKPIVAQNHAAGLSYWVPLSATNTHLHVGDDYAFRSALSAGMGTPMIPEGYDPENAEKNWAWLRARIDEFHRVRPFYYGDYYPLTRFSTDDDTWLAYQMHRPDLNEGMALALRRDESAFSCALFKLHGLNPDSQYVVENADNGETLQVSGKSLASGLEFTIAEPHGSLLFFYKGI